MSTPNWIALLENQHATYIVRSVFDYYLFMKPGSKVTFKAENPNNKIYIKKNIWGSPNVEIAGGDVVMEGSFGVAPQANLLTPNPYTYNIVNGSAFTEII